MAAATQQRKRKPAAAGENEPDAAPAPTETPTRHDHDDIQAIIDALLAPFDPDEVKWKPGAISGNRALALAYIDARVVQDRLDEVLGIDNWQDDYQFLPDGAVVCKLSVRLGGEWVTKMDVGGQSEQPDEGDRVKAAVSDALKRTAVKFGVGRYLYRLPAQWCDYDPQKRQFKCRPKLPASAMPAARPAPKQPAPMADAPMADAPMARGEQLDRIDVLREELGWTDDDLSGRLSKRFGTMNPRRLTAAQADQVIAGLEKALGDLRSPPANSAGEERPRLATTEDLERIDVLATQAGWSNNKLEVSLFNKFGTRNLRDLTADQAAQVIAGFERASAGGDKKPGKGQ